MIISDCSDCGEYKYLPIDRRCKDCIFELTISEVTGIGRFADKENFSMGSITGAFGEKEVSNRAGKVVIDGSIGDNDTVEFYENGELKISGEKKEEVRKEYSRVENSLMKTARFPLNFSGIKIDSLSGNLEMDILNGKSTLEKLRNSSNFSEEKDQTFKFTFKCDEKDDVRVILFINNSIEIKNCNSEQEIEDVTDIIIETLRKRTE